MEHYHLGELFIFTVVPLLPSLEVERGIGLELVQEKLLKLRGTGPRPSILVVNGDTMSSLLRLCSLQNCSYLLESPRPSFNHPCVSGRGGIKPPCQSMAGSSPIQTTMMLKLFIHSSAESARFGLNPPLEKPV